MVVFALVLPSLYRNLLPVGAPRRGPLHALDTQWRPSAATHLPRHTHPPSLLLLLMAVPESSACTTISPSTPSSGLCVYRNHLSAGHRWTGPAGSPTSFAPPPSAAWGFRDRARRTRCPGLGSCRHPFGGQRRVLLRLCPRGASLRAFLETPLPGACSVQLRLSSNSPAAVPSLMPLYYSSKAPASRSR